METCEFCMGEADCTSFQPSLGARPGYACTRKAGHDGEHVTCLRGIRHHLAVWASGVEAQDKDDRETAWMEQIADLQLSLRKVCAERDTLKAALYAECMGLSCGPHCAGGGYRSCVGCDIKARAAYGLGWGKE